MATVGLTPLEEERSEFGYYIEQIRFKNIRLIRRAQTSSTGNDSDTCIFFVHGGGGRACQFKHQIRTLQEIADVVAFDFLGHGDSPAPNAPALYTANEHLQDLNEVFMLYKRRYNFIVAHCYGALHTLRLMKNLKEKELLASVTGLVLISIGQHCPFPSHWLSSVPAFILEWLRPLARSSSNATLFTPETKPELISFENSISNNNRMYMMKVLASDCSDPARWATWLEEGKTAITKGEVPTLVICGEGDGVFSVDACQTLSQYLLVPEERFHIIKGVGHLSMLEKPEIVTPLLKQFVQQLS